MLNFIASELVLQRGEDWTGDIDFIASPPIFFETIPNEQELPQIDKVEINNEGMINRSVMQSLQAEAKGKHNLQGEWLQYERTLRKGGLNGIVRHGSFRVIEQEYDVGEDKTTFTMYDPMIKTHKEVHKDEFTISFPTTLVKLFRHIADICELETDVTSFKDGNTVVGRDEWTNTEYTYRDIFDHIAEVTGMVVGIKEDKLDIWGYEDTGLTISGEGSKTIMVGEEVGTFNILNVTQEPAHWNEPYPPNWTEIPQEERSEYVIENNPIVDYDRELYSPIVFNNIKDLNYTEFEAETFGWGIFDIGDVVTVKDLDGNTHKSIITGELGNFNQGFTSTIKSEKLSNAKDEYVVASDQRREGQRVYFLVDQQNGVIEGMVEEINEQSERISKLRIDLEGIATEVASINPNTNLIVNLAGTLDNYMYWEFENTDPIRYFDGLVYKEGLRYGSNFEIVDVDNSLSRKGKSFFGKGKAVSTYGYVVPDDVYSYRVRRIQGSHELKIEVREYDKESKLIKTTPYSFVGQAYHALTFKPAQNTMYVRIALEAVGATYSNRLILSEDMFNRGNPKEWQESVNEVQVWAKSQFVQTNNKIETTVEEIKVVDGKTESNKSSITQQADRIDSVVGDVDNHGSQISQMKGEIDLKVSKDGIIGGINASPETVKIKSNVLDFNNAKGNNVDLTGKINATSGKIGGYDIQSNTLVGNGVELGNNFIKVGDARLLPYTQHGNVLLAETGALIFRTPGQKTFNLQIEGLGSLIRVLLEGGSYITQGNLDRLMPLNSGFGIGSSSKRYQSIYLQNQPNVSSDRRIKNSIKDIPKDLIEHMVHIQPRQYIQNGQVHFGYIAQDVERELYKYCVNKYGYENAQLAMDKYAFIHKSESYLSLLYGEIQVLKDAYYQEKIKQLECDIIELNKKPKVSKGFRKRRGK